MDKIIVMTGAGMSADSGLQTFRDSGGLWEGYDVQKVATVEGWNQDPEMVLDFYNKRRSQAYQASPHEGHKALVKLEDKFDVTIITQNVDSLHEKAGSSKVIHLHGELSKVRSVDNPDLITDVGGDAIKLGDTAEDNSQLRPHVVWFGEMVPKMEVAAELVPTADLLMVIGTSLVVYPAAGLVDYARRGIPKYIIDPNNPELYDDSSWEYMQETAVTGVPELADKLLSNR